MRSFPASVLRPWWRRTLQRPLQVGLAGQHGGGGVTDGVINLLSSRHPNAGTVEIRQTTALQGGETAVVHRSLVREANSSQTGTRFLPLQSPIWRPTLW